MLKFKRLATVPTRQVRVAERGVRKIFDPSALKELGKSLRANGMIQPIVCFEKAGIFEVVAGNRRLLAAKRSGMKKVPIVIVEQPSAQEALLAALEENQKRRNLLPLEEAECYSRLIKDHGMAIGDVCRTVGLSRFQVERKIRLLGLAEPTYSALKNGKIDASLALAVDSVTDPGEQRSVLVIAIKEKLRAHEVAQLVKERQAPVRGPAKRHQLALKHGVSARKLSLRIGSLSGLLAESRKALIDATDADMPRLLDSVADVKNSALRLLVDTVLVSDLGELVPPMVSECKRFVEMTERLKGYADIRDSATAVRKVAEELLEALRSEVTRRLAANKRSDS